MASVAILPPSRQLRLVRATVAWRVGDPEEEGPILDATGSTVKPGRWNTADTPVLYASERCRTAVLEKLNGSRSLPPEPRAVRILLPAGASFELVTVARLPGWDRDEPDVSCRFGAQWAREGRSLLLRVPSAIVPSEWNWVINPRHPEFCRIAATPPQPIRWQETLGA